jgi:hypothetical protein
MSKGQPGIAVMGILAQGIKNGEWKMDSGGQSFLLIKRQKL